MRRVTIVAASAALAFAACNGAAHKASPAPPIGARVDPPDQAPPADEPAPIAEVAAPVAAEADPVATTGALPSWDDVPSGHPAGATDPPIPRLVVTPDGRCFKSWISPLAIRAAIPMGDRVDPCEDPSTCGTPIACPEPRAADLLRTHAAQEP